MNLQTDFDELVLDAATRDPIVSVRRINRELKSTTITEFQNRETYVHSIIVRRKVY